ncbi:MAG: hypothetical protein IKX68_01790, partial [Clostridiales bacterium]|nr:hypothetical protein [Clostridiales bacterium]
SRGEAYSGAELRGSGEANTMRYDHGSKLESDDPYDEGTGRNDRADEIDREGYPFERGNGFVYKPDEGYSPELRTNVEGRTSGSGKDMEGRTGIPSEELAGGYDETGWESERAICFSAGEDEDGIAETDAGEYGEVVSPDTDSVSAYDIACSSAYLAADIVSIFGSRPKEGETPHTRPVRERKNRQKDDRDGPVMSM